MMYYMDNFKKERHWNSHLCKNRKILQGSFRKGAQKFVKEIFFSHRMSLNNVGKGR